MHDVHILCQGRGLGHDGLRSIFCPLVCPRIVHHVFPHVPCTVSRVSNTRVQATLGVGSVNFKSFTIAWTGGGEPLCAFCTDFARLHLLFAIVHFITAHIAIMRVSANSVNAFGCSQHQLHSGTRCCHRRVYTAVAWCDIL